MQTESIAGVLLADGWHHVEKSGGFQIEAFKFTNADGEAQAQAQTGARWRDADGRTYFCPLASVLAVRYARARP